MSDDEPLLLGRHVQYVVDPIHICYIAAAAHKEHLENSNIATKIMDITNAGLNFRCLVNTTVQVGFTILRARPLYSKDRLFVFGWLSVGYRFRDRVARYLDLCRRLRLTLVIAIRLLLLVCFHDDPTATTSH